MLLAALLWAAAIFVSSSIPSTKLPKVAIWNADKIAHFGVYFVLAFLIHRLLQSQTRFPRLHLHPYIFTLVCTTLYGLSDEIHQLFVPGRNTSIEDLMADAAGAALFCLLHQLFTRRATRA